jgi:N-acetylneuraminate synthase
MGNLRDWYQKLIANPGGNVSPLLVAEIGINHNGDLNLAKRIIDIALASGCDYVKFQKRNPDICVPESMKNNLRETPWGLITYLEYKKKIEFGYNDFLEIDKYCRSVGIDWSASAWDFDSQNFLNKFNIPFNKVASAMNTNLNFVKRVAEEGKVTFLSTGMASLKDISKCVEIFNGYSCPLVLLHTVSTYPAKDEDLNLAVINTLKTNFNLPVGYSGHESSVSPSIAAAALGAVVIERHVTLNRTMWGTDQAASLEADGLAQLARVLKRIPKILGDAEKKFMDVEKKSASSLRYW